jgi:ferredoxin-NADP reductase
LYAARTEADIAFLDELRAIAGRFANVKVAITITRPAATAPWRSGRIDLAMVRQYVPHPEHTIFCVCGPGSMITDTEQMLRAAGVPPAQIRSEQFETTAAAAVLNPAPASTASTDTHTVTFAVSRRTVTASPDKTLLEAAEAGGVVLSSSCRAGVCQACRTRLVEGSADCRSDVLDPADSEAGFILPCVSWSTGDCVLEA